MADFQDGFVAIALFARVKRSRTCADAEFASAVPESPVPSSRAGALTVPGNLTDYEIEQIKVPQLILIVVYFRD